MGEAPPVVAGDVVVPLQHRRRRHDEVAEVDGVLVGQDPLVGHVDGRELGGGLYRPSPSKAAALAAAA